MFAKLAPKVFKGSGNVPVPVSTPVQTGILFIQTHAVIQKEKFKMPIETEYISAVRDGICNFSNAHISNDIHNAIKNYFKTNKNDITGKELQEILKAKDLFYQDARKARKKAKLSRDKDDKEYELYSLDAYRLKKYVTHQQIHDKKLFIDVDDITGSIGESGYGTIMFGQFIEGKYIKTDLIKEIKGPHLRKLDFEHPLFSDTRFEPEFYLSKIIEYLITEKNINKLIIIDLSCSKFSDPSKRKTPVYIERRARGVRKRKTKKKNKTKKKEKLKRK